MRSISICPATVIKEKEEIELNQKKKFALILVLSWVTYNVAYLCRLNISTVLDKLSVGLGVSVTYLGMASSIYFVTYALGQFVNGIIGDRVNPYKYMIMALVGTGAINLILAFQTSGLLFLILWGLNGVFQSVFWSITMRLLAIYATERQKKLVAVVMGTCSISGYVFSWVVLASLFKNSTFSPYFYVPAIIAFIVLLVWCFEAKKMPYRPDPTGKDDAPPLKVVAHDFVQDHLIYVMLLAVVVGAIQEGASFWLPMVFTDLLGLGDDSLLLLMLVPISRTLGMFLAQWCLTIFHDNLKPAAVAALLVSTVLAVGLVVTSRHTSILTIVLILLLLSVVHSVNWYLVDYLPLFFAARHIVATLVGALDFSTYLGAALMSGTLGVLLVMFGWPALPVVWLALCVLSLVLALTGAGGCLQRKGEHRLAEKN